MGQHGQVQVHRQHVGLDRDSAGIFRTGPERWSILVYSIFYIKADFFIEMTMGAGGNHLSHANLFAS